MTLIETFLKRGKKLVVFCWNWINGGEPLYEANLAALRLKHPLQMKWNRCGRCELLKHIKLDVLKQNCLETHWVFVNNSDLNEHIWSHMCLVFSEFQMQLKFLEYLPELIDPRPQVSQICFIGGRPPDACQTRLNGFNVNILTLSPFSS